MNDHTRRGPPDHAHGAAPRPTGLGLVLGGGAIKGLAHVGALLALEEADIRPSLYAGTSIGAMIAAAAASGRSASDLYDRALKFRRRDLFRINHLGMLMDRMLSRSIYLEAPLRDLTDELVGEGTFREFATPLLVTAVDLEHGTPIVFGTRGMTDVRVRDAVYASCALPGFFPPGVVGGRICVDGGTTDNLPVAIAGRSVASLIAIDVGIADVPVMTNIAAQGFASIFMRAATMMMHEQQQSVLEHWVAPAMLLVRPPVSHVGWFTFARTEELLRVGYESMRDALQHIAHIQPGRRGIFPRRDMRVSVDRTRCTGCGMCAARAPNVMALDVDGLAYPLTPVHEWSPADGAFVRSCPVGAISAEPVAR